MLTIVVYHYVRDLPRTRYPKIKGLLTEKFEGQLDYITRHYRVCSMKQVIESWRNGEELPPNACLLTFDDGLLDHYLTVFPRLEERGIVGSFYPPAEAIERHKVLDVHKIHFVLASATDDKKLADDLLDLIRPYRSDYDIPNDADLYKQYADVDRYDPPEIVFIKSVLQRGLPEQVRAEIVHGLFTRYVTGNETAFAKELYVDLDQLRCMARHDMEIGGHGYKHVWLETLSRTEQQEEIDRTINFLTKISGEKPSDWIMCYPYGSYNNVTLELLNPVGCILGLSTRVDLVSDFSNPLELARLDTNDLPFSGDAAISEWTRKTLS